MNLLLLRANLPRFLGFCLPHHLPLSSSSSITRFGIDPAHAVSYHTRKLFCSQIVSHPCELGEGTIISLERRFTLHDVRTFCRICQLSNPIHLHLQDAQRLGFSDRVVPEMLYAGIFPAIIGTHFPGSIYISQKLEFRSPVLVDDGLHAEVKAIHLRNFRDKYRVEFITTCWKVQENVIAVEGNAVALIPCKK